MPPDVGCRISDFGSQGHCSGTGPVTVAARNGSWTRRWSFEVEYGMERGVAKNRDTARRSARATVVGLGFVSLFFSSGCEGWVRSGAVGSRKLACGVGECGR